MSIAAIPVPPLSRRVSITLGEDQIKLLDWCVKNMLLSNRSMVIWRLLRFVLPAYVAGCKRAMQAGLGQEAQDAVLRAFEDLSKQLCGEELPEFEKGHFEGLRQALGRIQFTIAEEKPVIDWFERESRKKVVVDSFQRAIHRRNRHPAHLKPVPPSA